MKKLMLLLIVGVLTSAFIGSNAVWAGGTFTPISGTMYYVVVDGGTQWLDEDGILHIRDAVMEWDFPEGEGDFVGTGWGIFNMNIDPTTGNGETQGFHYLDLSFGEVSGSFVGHADCTLTGFVIACGFVAHGDGGFAGMHLRLDVTSVYGSGVYEIDGILHDPKGREGDKSFPTEAKSWSSVKALYR